LKFADRPILMKNSVSVQRRFFSFLKKQPKIRGKHDVRLAESHPMIDRFGFLKAATRRWPQRDRDLPDAGVC
jgi:hypothetical protein